MKALLFFIVTFTIFFPKLNAITIQNDSILLVTDGVNISSLFDRKKYFQYVSDYANTNGFFEISYVNATTLQPIGTLKSTDFLTNQISFISSSTNQAQYAYENNTARIIVTIQINGIKAEILWNINVELKNIENYISMVDFPRYRITSSGKKFIDPAYEGRIFGMESSMSPFTKSYPGKQSIQMSACLGSAGGVMLWTDDINGHVKSFGYIRSGNYSNMSVHHLMPFENSRWQSTYNTRMTLCGNQWQDAAEIYRNWALQQSWSNKPLRNRKDVPELLHQIPLTFTGQITLENLSTLPAILKEWADMFGTRVIYEPTHWEKHYKYTGIDYFPVSVGNDPYKNMNSNGFKTKGIVHAGCIESYHWTRSLIYDPVKIPNADAQNVLLENFFVANNGSNLCRTQLDGSIETFEIEGRNEVFLCRGTDYGKTFLQQTSRILFDLGVSAIHNDYDQLMGLEGLCFNKSHGHPIPYGSWQIDVMNKVYSDIIAEAKSRNITDFYLTKEWPTELFNMKLHGNQVRNYQILNDPTQIPLYLYIYHDYISSLYGYGWMQNTAANNAANDDELAAMLIYGQLPALAFWQATIKSPNRADLLTTNAKTLLTDYFGAMKKRAKGYLFYGRLLKPLISSAPTTLIHNTWQDSIGNVGVFATNMLTTSTTVAVKVPGATKKFLNIFNGNTLVSSTEVNGGENYNWEIPAWRLSYIIFSDNQLTATNQVIANKKDIPVYPNPVINELNINIDNDIANWKVEIMDITGKTLICKNNTRNLYLNGLEAGIYFLKINYLDEYLIKRIIKY